ncbi:hypothetical protein NP233_g1586 [Leucocoprinus birnbaumii]|uniref:protein-tyrosine-phosphatase n=1 Tax=Leucocoprinus birnbaumii TaxID=56174 RepID=A0AAD5VZN9_9AGAR|nr:hypothetical protein NP233_g1586 [Leucocoprinus birnbaumii]
MVPVTSQAPSSSEILKDQLYLGNFAAAQSPEHRKKLAITHLLSVCNECPLSSSGPTGLAHLQITVEDTEYSDLLIHLPKTSRFIQEALQEGGRVLVHCVMGVSRSTTVVAAFLMKHRKMDARSALRYIKQRRPQVHPNYGFIKQLDTYAKCQFEPCSTNPVYRSWKKRQGQDVTAFLNSLVDTVSIIPQKLLLNSDFPEDTRQAESLLADLGITHVLSVSPAEIPQSVLAAVLKSPSHYHHVDVRNNAKEDLLLALPGAVSFLEQAMRDGLVLVHSQMEARACTVACASLMKQRCLAPDEAFSTIEDALPLFNPTVNFSRNLELYDACGYQPTRNHPVVREWLASDRPENRLNHSRTVEAPTSYPRRPSGSIISSSTPQALTSLSGIKTSSFHPSAAPVTVVPTPSSHPVMTRRKSPSYASSSSFSTAQHPHSVTSSAEMDLEARAKDILSNTGFDLSGFADTLKDIEKTQTQRAGRTRGSFTVQKRQQATVGASHQSQPEMPRSSGSQSNTNPFSPLASSTSRRKRFLFESTGRIKQLTPESKQCLYRLASYRPPKLGVQIPRSRRAAVLVALFVGRNGDLYVLLSRRSATLRTYAGDTSLPGGKVDPEDKNIEDTARREAFEEIGLSRDRRKVPLLCILEPFLAAELVVTPVVVLILDNTLRPILNTDEVASLFSHPLASFLSTTSPFTASEPETVEVDYHKSFSVEWSAPHGMKHPFLVHQFLTGREAGGIKPIFGLTAGMLIRVATIGYGREPEFQVNDPTTPSLEKRIAWALLNRAVFRKACEEEGLSLSVPMKICGVTRSEFEGMKREQEEREDGESRDGRRRGSVRRSNWLRIWRAKL